MPRLAPQQRSLIPHGRRLAAATLVMLLLLVTGCGPKNFQNTNDELRAERLELQRRVADLEQQLQQRSGELEALRAANAPQAGTPIGEPPVFSLVKFARYSGPIDSNGDGRDDLLRLYMRTLDQKGRMLPLTARATVQLAVLAEGQKPRLYTEKTYDSADFDAAYRTGLTGTHYSFELPLGDDVPSPLTVMVTITDAAGIAHSAQQTFDVSR